MAERFYKTVAKTSVDCRFLRVPDEDLSCWGKIIPIASDARNLIESVPLATPEDMLESDIILLGCPTYFGNVSAEMKAYMDSACLYWLEARLSGKILGVFTSASNSYGGGDLCLKSIITFGQHMGMVHVPPLSNLCEGLDIPAYGPISLSGPAGDRRPSDSDYRIIDAYSEFLIKKVKP